jgi:hypothetical protein
MPKTQEFTLNMKGSIYSRQKCRLYGSTFRDSGRDGLVCPEHPDQRATRFMVRFGRELCRRFLHYRSAERFLTGLRYKTDEGTFDLRDYRADNPLGFTSLANRWLAIKKMEVRPKTHNSLTNFLRRAMAEWGNRNIREIGYPDIEDLLLSQPGYCMSDRHERPRIYWRRHRQGTENLLAEDILKYLSGPIRKHSGIRVS